MWTNQIVMSLGALANSVATLLHTAGARSKTRFVRLVSMPGLSALVLEPRERGSTVGQMSEFGVVLGVVDNFLSVKIPLNKGYLGIRFK